MTRSLFLGRVVAVLAFVAVVALAGPPFTAQANGPAEFSHRDHVQDLWEDGPEVLRDCRGCHVYPKQEGMAPQDLCTWCHFEAFQSSPANPRPAPQAGQRRTIEGFAHEEHATLACHFCHDRESIGGEKLPPGMLPEMPKPTGFKHCAACHGSESRYAKLSKRKENQLDGAAPGEGWEQRFFAAMDADPDMGPARVEPFRHDEHMLTLKQPLSLSEFLAKPAESTAAANDCATCHRSVLSAITPDLGSAVFSQEGCSTCHQGPDRTPLVFGHVPASRTSPAARTFVHADHLRAQWKGSKDVDPEKRKEIQAETCFACHEHPEGGATFVLKKSLAGYAGCLACHTGEPWTGAGTADSHPARGWWHGEWKRCDACHFGANADEWKERPRWSGERRRPTTFTITTQAHPGLVGDPRAEDCAKCHKAGVQELPSRIVRARFRHETHVPALTEENRSQVLRTCADCHDSRVNQAGSSSDVGRVLGDPDDHGLSYKPSGCVDCHRGSPPVPDGFESVPVDVVDFPHRLHLDPRGLSVKEHQPPSDCVTCHLGPKGPEAGADGKLGILQEAAKCSLCHAHDDGVLARVTGAFTRTDLSSCVDCHKESLPIPDAQLTFQRIALGVPPTIQEGMSQIHPPERTCTDCHVVAPDEPFFERGTESRITAKSGNPHETGRELNTCEDCHWNQAKGKMQVRSLDRANIGDRLVDGLLQTRLGYQYPGQPGVRPK